MGSSWGNSSGNKKYNKMQKTHQRIAGRGKPSKAKMRRYTRVTADLPMM